MFFDMEEPFTHGASNVGRVERCGVSRQSGARGSNTKPGKAAARCVAAAVGNETGYEASVSYQLNFQMQLTAGWQHMRFARSSGAFYDGLARVDGDAFFLHTAFRV